MKNDVRKMSSEALLKLSKGIANSRSVVFWGEVKMPECMKTLCEEKRETAKK